ncbi:ABC transporter substrate-binding protein [Catenovulum sediminis]|uniref:ABC transporter substrate-binding protein n=1 Tax=Catenovulum sediminis TaxID=1740262 RepID=A0ABV1RGH0_9ALTE|nr:ABC transporter substrate-binding protein [Catenovulum sediminis]
MRLNVLSVIYLMVNFTLMSWQSLAQDSKACHLKKAENSLKTIHVLAISPEASPLQFWGIYRQILTAAAKDLNIHLELINIEEKDDNRFSFQGLLQNRLSRSPKPDFVLTPLFLNAEFITLELFEQYKVPFMVVNTSVSKSFRQRVGKPREKYSQWLGNLTPNDEQAGYDLARILIEQAKKSKQSKSITIAAISGPTDSSVSQLRVSGLAKASSHLKAHQLPEIYTNWHYGKSLYAAQAIFRRMPDTQVVWTAGPDIAHAVADYLANQPFKNKVLVGTFDWTPNSLKLLKNGEIYATMGGHFVDGAWALVMLLDYANNIDFAQELGTDISTKLHPLTAKDAAHIESVLFTSNWQNLDFKQFSKCYTPSRRQYDFSLKALFSY